MIKPDYSTVMNLDKEDDYVINREGNKIIYSGDLTAKSVQDLLTNLCSYGETEHITLYFSSHGGEVRQTLSLLDILNTMKDRVTIIGYGELYSCGGFLLFTKCKTLVTQSVSFMSHPISCCIHGTYQVREANINHFAKLEDMVKKLYLSKGLDLNNKYDIDYLEAGQLLEIGIVDEIL